MFLSFVCGKIISSHSPEITHITWMLSVNLDSSNCKQEICQHGKVMLDVGPSSMLDLCGRREGEAAGRRGSRAAHGPSR